MVMGFTLPVVVMPVVVVMMMVVVMAKDLSIGIKMNVGCCSHQLDGDTVFIIATSASTTHRAMDKVIDDKKNEELFVLWTYCKNFV